jgi:hypothetical protein
MQPLKQSGLDVPRFTTALGDDRMSACAEAHQLFVA